MERQKIIVEPAVEIGDFTFTVIAVLKISGDKGNFGIYYYGSKKPLAVVIATRSEVKAYTASGSNIPFNKLIEFVPELSKLLFKKESQKINS
jgi:hypothetical protein